MHRKMARPTDSAGKVMWNAAVVANCHRDRSMKVCVFIFFRVPWAVQTAGQAQAERGRAGSGGKIMAGGPGGNPVAPPGPANDHDGAITPVPHPGRRPIRLPASRDSGLAVSWGSDAAHVRNAIARFDQVEGVTGEERDRAWKRIQAAAGTYGVHVSEGDWRELFPAGKQAKLGGGS